MNRGCPGGRGRVLGDGEADSKTLAKPIKRDKLDEIFQAQKLELEHRVL